MQRLSTQYFINLSVYNLKCPIQIQSSISPSRIGVFHLFFSHCPFLQIKLHRISRCIRNISSHDRPFLHQCCCSCNNSRRKTAPRSLSKRPSRQRNEQIYSRCCQIRCHLVIWSKPSPSLKIQTVIQILISCCRNTSG